MAFNTTSSRCKSKAKDYRYIANRKFPLSSPGNCQSREAVYPSSTKITRRGFASMPTMSPALPTWSKRRKRAHHRRSSLLSLLFKTQDESKQSWRDSAMLDSRFFDISSPLGLTNHDRVSPVSVQHRPPHRPAELYRVLYIAAILTTCELTSTNTV
ncbi:uncharacterized protein K489DRAFT_382264 [Dissoconium aciculare CBS 342.82]|uniref:Uncharacterized protein n=1 Tax=Dissoconium aciculare CBS 342.82 TaxID=1314786 RepID=A0A6J3LZK0_9PEZI|nr:uncharacterized protein K489DRAFT_382264 [Dissoconium aciculare CBS 342.82]KAF1821215.1 hypothetical protein K489DRAFT_382264 [Dissoconium aciculare CBS 342.82]